MMTDNEIDEALVQLGKAISRQEAASIARLALLSLKETRTKLAEYRRRMSEVPLLEEVLRRTQAESAEYQKRGQVAEAGAGAMHEAIENLCIAVDSDIGFFPAVEACRRVRSIAGEVGLKALEELRLLRQAVMADRHLHEGADNLGRQDDCLFCQALTRLDQMAIAEAT